jgi:multicomponent K+:H+ antiporter subunit E
MRLFPAPILSAMLFASWLMLVGSVSAGQVALATLLAIFIPLWSARLDPDRARIAAWGTVVRLTIVVLYDIVASALVVARQILGPEERIRPGFVWVPLAIRDPHGVASLASIITMTPGTLSVDLSSDRQQLLVHALHVDDPAELIASIKERYERPLLAIFEGNRR